MANQPNALAGRTGEGPPVAPVGWKWSAGSRVKDMSFISSTGRRFKSKVSLAKYLDSIPNSPPPDAFQWKHSVEDYGGLPLPGIPKPKRSMAPTVASRAEDVDTDAIERNTKRRRLNSTEKEEEDSEDSDLDEYPIDIHGCEKLEDGASYYAVPSHRKKQSGEKNELDDTYYLTPDEIAVTVQKNTPSMRLTETLGPEESCLNNTHFVHPPDGLDYKVAKKKGQEQAFLNIEEYRFEINRPLDLIKSVMDSVNLLLSNLNKESNKGKGKKRKKKKKKIDFNVYDFINEHALKQIDPELCQLVSSGYDGLLKLSSTLEEKANKYQEEIQNKKNKLEELSMMITLNIRISNFVEEQKKKQDKAIVEKNFSDKEIDLIKEIYKKDGEKIVAEVEKDVFKTCKKISKRFSREITKIKRQLKIKH